MFLSFSDEMSCCSWVFLTHQSLQGVCVCEPRGPVPSVCRIWNAPPAAWSLSRPLVLQASLSPLTPPPSTPPTPAPLFSRTAIVLLGPTLGVCLSLIVCPSLRT